MKLTKRTQEKIQDLLKVQGYIIRYERGNFKGGYCIVRAQKTIIINKFHPLESKVSTLMDIVKDIEIDEELLSEDQHKMVKQIMNYKE